MSGPVVAVVGGGASGCLAAASLVRAARTAGRAVEVLVVEPGRLGEGVAYSTDDPRHRLNVPARGMSMWPDDPTHFVRWLRRHVDVDFPDAGFAPRLHYAHYLRHGLEAELGDAARVTFTHLRASAVDLRPHGRRLRLVLADRTHRPVDAVVLALGAGPAADTWAPEALRRSGRFVPDAWDPDVTPEVAPGDEVVLVGAGLTMLDMAQGWYRDGVRLHVVSRHGLVPLPHAVDPQPAIPPDVVLDAGALDLAAMRRLVVDHVHAVRGAGGDWRQAIDGFRGITSRLWARLPRADREAFVASTARHWDRARHRTDPSVHAWFAARRAEGSVRVHRGCVVEARDDGEVVEVVLSDGSRIRAAAVVNCTGTYASVRRRHDPLLMNLLDAGLVQPGPLDLGVATLPDGRVRPDAPGIGLPAVWAIGALRRGELWESTAVPELRVHAQEIAASVMAELPSPRLRRRPRDPYGLPVSTSDAAAALYAEALGRVLRVQSGADQLVAEAVRADPGFAVGHAVQALLGVEWGCPVDVEGSLAVAQRAAARADERERRFVDVATARVTAPGPESAAALISYIHAYPEDALAVSLAVPTIAFGGATEIPAEAWALVEGLQPVYDDDWWYLGLLAFVRQEQDRHEEADELARRALALEPAAGHAVHAKAHVHYETGDHEAGLRWIDRWISTCGARASHRAHFSWHAALHELALGDDVAAAARYEVQLAPPTVDGVRALVDSASLVWRGRAVGAWTSSDVGAVLEVVPDELMVDPPTPFVALHAAVALAAAGDCHGLVRLRRAAEAREHPTFQRTVGPLAEAFADLVHGDADRAVDGLLRLEGVEQLGGSAAQREIVAETLVYCAVEAGRLDLADRLLGERLARRPSPRDEQRRQELRALARTGS